LLMVFWIRHFLGNLNSRMCEWLFQSSHVPLPEKIPVFSALFKTIPQNDPNGLSWYGTSPRVLISQKSWTVVKPSIFSWQMLVKYRTNPIKSQIYHRFLAGKYLKSYINPRFMARNNNAKKLRGSQRRRAATSGHAPPSSWCQWHWCPSSAGLGNLSSKSVWIDGWMDACTYMYMCNDVYRYIHIYCIYIYNVRIIMSVGTWKLIFGVLTGTLVDSKQPNLVT
jgi:hypothetical protein